MAQYIIILMTHQSSLANARAPMRYTVQLMQLHGKWTQNVTCAKCARKIVLMRPAFCTIALENRAKIERDTRGSLAFFVEKV